MNRLGSACAIAFAAITAVTLAQAPASQPVSTILPPDVNGNPHRLAPRTGHVSNYDETRVTDYSLPDSLVLDNGRRVADANSWTCQRRAEIIREYETRVFGRVPSSAPKVTWTVAEVDRSARDGAAVMKRVVGVVGSGADAPRLRVTLHTPARVTGQVPVILLLNFGGGQPVPGAQVQNLPTADPPVAMEILARGWGYAMVGYQDIQPDRAGALTQGVIGLSLKPGQQIPAHDEWGSISAWSWGASRIIDYLATDPSVDASRIALQGFSRLGKTALWASALDQRIAVVFSACSGEMGAALSRRDYGETVDDMAHNFPWQFAASFQQWPGRWNDMPIDAHMLIALSAPRPVFLTGGTADQWADPKGMFLAAAAADPVYRLLGKRGLGRADLPPPDTALTTGELGWRYHTGGHTVPAEDWRAFLEFLDKYF